MGVDGRVAVAGDQPDLVAKPEPVSGGRDRESAVLVGGALRGRGGLVTDDRRTRVESDGLEAGIEDARSSAGRLTVAVDVAHTIGDPSRVARPVVDRLAPRLFSRANGATWPAPCQPPS